MEEYDVFNGDADGILSLLQLRQVQAKSATLVTGVKRDINLLKKIPVNGQAKHLTVLDISMEKNMEALERQLADGASVFYADHHRAGNIPNSEKLQAHIDLDAHTCTALIVDKLLKGEKHLWAITAAYGDNLIAVADELALKAGLTSQQASQLQELGTLINYNGYGESLADLHYDPAELFQLLLVYQDPFACVADEDSPYAKLKQAYQLDHDKAQNAKLLADEAKLQVIELEDEAWARRISGVYGNELANRNPDKAILVLTQNQDLSYRVSLRAPLNNRQGAGDICAGFATGGGRAAAAGINQLANGQLDELIDKVRSYYHS